MNRKFHELQVEAFVLATEDGERVRTALGNLLGEEPGDRLEEHITKGAHNNPITILRVSITRNREITRVLDRWRGIPIMETALAEAEERMDDDCVFHIRADKNRAYLGEIARWIKGEAVEIRIKAATYPSSKLKALSILRETLGAREAGLDHRFR